MQRIQFDVEVFSLSSLSAKSLSVKGKRGLAGEDGDTLWGTESAPAFYVAGGVTSDINIEELNIAGVVSGKSGIYYEGSGKLSVKNCRIINNEDSGIKINSNADVTLTDTQIGGDAEHKNTAEKGGGIYKTGSGSLTLTNCNISNNEADTNYLNTHL